MHPNTFIEQLWRGTETDSVFVAMRFSAEYESRFYEVFRPAIEAVQYQGKALKAVRVDESQTGDSILTEIIRGICESRLVLADVSDLSKSPSDPEAHRNGNVMYELGLAHAVKSPAKVLVVRDDSKRLLFDVSSIPHITLDFASQSVARERITRLLADRLRESESIEDIRLRAIVDGITQPEFVVLMNLHTSGKSDPLDLTVPTSRGRVLPMDTRHALQTLRDAGLIRSHLKRDPPGVLYSLTERGKRAVVAVARAWPRAPSPAAGANPSATVAQSDAPVDPAPGNGT
jgi:hypothetical protein